MQISTTAANQAGPIGLDRPSKNDAAINASFETLFKQAPATAGSFFRQAISEIDLAFGKGYARDNPALVASLIGAATADFNTASTLKVLQATVDRLSSSVAAVANAIDARTVAAPYAGPQDQQIGQAA